MKISIEILILAAAFGSAGLGRWDEAVQGLASKGLNEGQLQAATLLLTTPNHVVEVQGFAGTGKTFILHGDGRNGRNPAPK